MNINLPGDKAISPVIGQRFAAALPPAHSFTETRSVTLRAACQKHADGSDCDRPADAVARCRAA
jgi:hypothetical protein